jgi:hypothetical protein
MDFNGSLIEIYSNNNNNHTSIIRTYVNNQVTFDLSNTGELTLSHLHLNSGGLSVDSGGVEVNAGGLSVFGGITILSGGLSIENTSLTSEQIFAKGSDDSSHSLIVATTPNSLYSGSMVDLVANSSSSNFNFLTARNSNETVFEINEVGDVSTKGEISVGDMLINQHTNIMGDLQFSKNTVYAGDSINVPTNAVFVEVMSDFKDGSNELFFSSDDESLPAGKMLIVRNKDESALHSKILRREIPPGSTALLLFDGVHWIDVEALHSPVTELNNISQITLSNDVSMGNFTLTVRDISLMDKRPGDILVVGKSGVLQSKGGLSFHNGILSSPGLKVDLLLSDIDAKHKTIS